MTVPTPDGRVRALVADPALAAGGPEPGDPDSALQVRQRLLAETALMALESRDPGRDGGDVPVSYTHLTLPTN